MRPLPAASVRWLRRGAQLQAEAREGGLQGCTAGVGVPVLLQERPRLSKCKTESQTWSGPTWAPLPSPFQFPVCLGGLPGLWGPCSAISPASSLPTPPKLWTKTKFLFTLKAQKASRCEFKEE